MSDVEFTYPGCTKPQVVNINVRVSMASRVACVGANGAGKSTMIKLLTGEMKPSKGTVYKHPNCRFAYVAQHAFHHIEQHLDKSPNEYIQWRYADGEDKEALQKTTAKVTEEEAAKMKVPMMVQFEDENGEKKTEKRVLEKLMGRRKEGKDYVYEIKWINRSQDMNTWEKREKLLEIGFKKLVEEIDRRKAAQEGAYARTLSARNVEGHLGDCGLEAELASHCRISSLSGGQKVKVVLAACTWAQPHIIILDEPTNYLDRESLGALANAITSYEGGVLLITHNQEFADATTRETWVVANNRCDIKGDAEWDKYANEALELGLGDGDNFDAAGNKVEVSTKKDPASLKPREKKKMMKELKIKIKDELDLSEFEEACAAAWGMWAA
jgi:elongation factor 3